LGKIIIVFIILYTYLLNQESPREPSLPSVKDITNDKKEENKDNYKKKVKHNTLLSVKLCDGREISGEFEYTKEELLLKHIIDGIYYEKTLKLNEIKKIYIQSWQASKLKKVKDGITYQFNPKDIRIHTRDGEVYKIKGILSNEFLKIQLKNKNGTTVLFTYWIDLQYENGNWYTRLPTMKGNEREDCHSDVIRLIQFEREEN